MHNWPGIPVGHFAIRRGPAMAAADRFEITIEGRGGHAAHPHKNVDSLLVGAQVVTALQTILARNVDPLEAAVISVCSFKAGDAFNVMPQFANLLGTVRTLTPDMRDLCEERIMTVTQNIAAAFGATANVNYMRGYPVTFNHDEQTEFMSKVAAQVGYDVDTTVLPQMGAEDFSYMLNERPGAYIFMGNGNTAECHHPAYDFNDEAIPFGASLWAKIVEERLPAR
jgi:amidohydrolase